MKYYIIAGEASGDLHGSNLMKSLKKIDPRSDFRYFGGDLMQSQGGYLVCHYRKMAYMGLFDVLANLRTIYSYLALCKKDIREYSPDVVILIDYPGFNMRIAEYAHKAGMKVFYYIAPKVWAWRKSRIMKIKKYVHQLFVIFPFEIDFFSKYGVHAEYYGNPLKDAIFQYREKAGKAQGILTREDGNSGPLIALIAGSRVSEIKHCLPEMVRAASFFPSFRFIVAGVPTIDENKYEKILSGTPTELVRNITYKVLDHADAAIVTSGTATLETALFHVPQVVIYKVGWLTYFLGRLVVKVKYFSLVNIIAGREVVKELLQHNLAVRIKDELNNLMHSPGYRNKMLADYQDVSASLGEHGVSDRLASRMYELLSATL